MRELAARCDREKVSFQNFHALELDNGIQGCGIFLTRDKQFEYVLGIGRHGVFDISRGVGGVVKVQLANLFAVDIDQRQACFRACAQGRLDLFAFEGGGDVGASFAAENQFPEPVVLPAAAPARDQGFWK